MMYNTNMYRYTTICNNIIYSSNNNAAVGHRPPDARDGPERRPEDRRNKDNKDKKRISKEELKKNVLNACNEKDTKDKRNMKITKE